MTKIKLPIINNYIFVFIVPDFLTSEVFLLIYNMEETYLKAISSASSRYMLYISCM